MLSFFGKIAVSGQMGDYCDQIVALKQAINN